MRLLLLLLGATAAAAAAVDQARRCDQVSQVLSRLSDLVDFYASDPDRVNADGYFGLRLSRDLLAPGQVRLALRAACPGGRWLRQRHHLGQLDSVLARQSRLVGRFVRGLAESGGGGYDAVTFERICQPLARRLGRLVGSPRRPPAPKLPSVVSGGANLADRAGMVAQLIRYAEPRGDACLLGALRTGVGCSEPEPSCPYFQRSLWESSGYYLTHQLLYRLAVTLKACPHVPIDQPVKETSFVTLPTELTASCGKIFREFKLIETANWTKIALDTDGDTVTALRDLYMEQALLCGLIGAKDFYHRVSVETVASWQDPQLGCFKIFGDTAPVGVGRRILRDAEMLGGCSAHSSGVAMGFYSNAIRYLLNV